ncbi:hypothetical protein BS78_10G024500 [Paspalum vaginatum]|nr:hypothetical protein BS78_10G024500 [Paspalum vaginatum]
MIHHPTLSAARCFVPLHPDRRPRATTPCRRWPSPCNRNRTLPPTAKPRRWSRGPRRDRSWGDGDDGSGSDSDVDDGFFGAEEDEDEEAEREDQAPGRPAAPAPQLRGSDVLRALQRAAAAKDAARKNKDKKPAARQRQGKEKPEPGRDVEVGEVRPVVVRPEWAGRIRELELRVRELVDKYHQ